MLIEMNEKQLTQRMVYTVCGYLAFNELITAFSFW